MALRDVDLVPSKKTRPGWKKIALVALSALVIAFFTRLLIHSQWIFPFKLANNEMKPALLAGETVLVHRSVKAGEIKPGSILLLHLPGNPKKLIVRRAAALSGQRIQIVDKQVFINEVPLTEKWEQDIEKSLSYAPVPGSINNRDNTDPVLVSPGFVYVLADDRLNAMDSRHFGPVRMDMVVGLIEPGK